MTIPPETLDRHFLAVNYLQEGFQSLMIDILRLFKEHAPVYLSALRNALTQGDLQEAVEQAHALKGTAGSTGAALLAQLAGQLETAALAGESERCAALLAQLDGALGRTVQAIDEELARQQDGQDFFS